MVLQDQLEAQRELQRQFQESVMSSGSRYCQSSACSMQSFLLVFVYLGTLMECSLDVPKGCRAHLLSN